MSETSISSLARSLGVSPPAVSKAIKTGRIPASLVGSKELGSGRHVPVILDARAARLAFVDSENPSHHRNGSGASSFPSSTADPNAIPPIQQSKAISEAFKAQMARLEYEERSAKLVNAEEFRIQFSAMIVTARTRLLGVPSKAKGRIPHLTIDEVEILTDLIREALEGLPTVHERVRALLDEIRPQWVSLILDDAPASPLTEEAL